MRWSDIAVCLSGSISGNRREDLPTFVLDCRRRDACAYLYLINCKYKVYYCRSIYCTSWLIHLSTKDIFLHATRNRSLYILSPRRSSNNSGSYKSPLLPAINGEMKKRDLLHKRENNYAHYDAMLHSPHKRDSSLGENRIYAKIALRHLIIDRKSIFRSRAQ